VFYGCFPLGSEEAGALSIPVPAFKSLIYRHLGVLKALLVRSLA
jgi:hypothetical protein